MSVSEKVFWGLIRKRRLGFELKRQVPVGPYVMDFYCPAAALCVEVDGEQHAMRTRADSARDEWLVKRGVITIRVPSLDLFEASTATNTWLNLIQETCQARTAVPSGPDLHPQPPPSRQVGTRKHLASLHEEGASD